MGWDGSVSAACRTHLRANDVHQPAVPRAAPHWTRSHSNHHRPSPRLAQWSFHMRPRGRCTRLEVTGKGHGSRRHDPALAHIAGTGLGRLISPQMLHVQIIGSQKDAVHHCRGHTDPHRAHCIQLHPCRRTHKGGSNRTLMNQHHSCRFSCGTRHKGCGFIRPCTSSRIDSCQPALPHGLAMWGWYAAVSIQLQFPVG